MRLTLTPLGDEMAAGCCPVQQTACTYQDGSVSLCAVDLPAMTPKPG
jgi:hypothetical protein